MVFVCRLGHSTHYIGNNPVHPICLGTCITRRHTGKRKFYPITLLYQIALNETGNDSSLDNGLAS